MSDQQPTITVPDNLTDGLAIYEFIANNIHRLHSQMPQVVEMMTTADRDGQFCVSAARYLHAIDSTLYAEAIDTLVQAAITKDRERAYIGHLLPSLWGNDYMDKAPQLSESDNNFRRIFKRIHSTGI